MLFSNAVWATYGLEKLFRVTIILLFIFRCITICPNPFLLVSLELVIPVFVIINFLKLFLILRKLPVKENVTQL